MDSLSQWEEKHLPSFLNARHCSTDQIRNQNAKRFLFSFVIQYELFDTSSIECERTFAFAFEKQFNTWMDPKKEVSAVRVVEREIVWHRKWIFLLSASIDSWWLVHWWRSTNQTCRNHLNEWMNERTDARFKANPWSRNRRTISLLQLGVPLIGENRLWIDSFIHLITDVHCPHTFNQEGKIAQGKFPMQLRSGRCSCIQIKWEIEVRPTIALDRQFKRKQIWDDRRAFLSSIDRPMISSDGEEKTRRRTRRCAHWLWMWCFLLPIFKMKTAWKLFLVFCFNLFCIINISMRDDFSLFHLFEKEKHFDKGER